MKTCVTGKFITKVIKFNDGKLRYYNLVTAVYLLAHHVLITPRISFFVHNCWAGKKVTIRSKILLKLIQ